VNLAQVLGSTVLPVLVGLALGAVGATAAGSGLCFLLLAAVLGLGMAGYRFLPRG
jgi:hypothetical protein